MPTKHGKSGGKYSGKHTTLTPVAIEVCGVIEKCQSINRISPGIIKQGSTRSGIARVKVVEILGGLKLVVTGNRATQHVLLYSADVTSAKVEIALACEKLSIPCRIT